MRRSALVSTFLLVAVLLGGVACDRGPDRVRTTFKIEGMHCDACSTSIVATLERVDGVEEASADYELGMAEAVYNPRAASADELKTEIEKLGYTVVGMETEVVEG